MTYDKNVDGGAIDIYVNGVKEGTSATATFLNTNTNPITIGRSGTSFFDGQIDDVRIFNRKLTPSEIKWLYAGGNVNWVDLWCLASNWLDSNCGDCNGADFDGNGKVDLYDFAVMGANWEK
jgi:hypothetical protein